MRFISMLLTLLFIGFLVQKQLSSKSPTFELEGVATNSGVAVPKVPRSTQELKKFEKDINQLMQNSTNNRSREIEEALNK